MKIDGLQILFQMVNFGVVFGALTFLLYKPVLKVLDERSKKIHEAQQAADQALAEKAELDETKRKAKQAAEKEANKIIEEAKQTAQQQADHVVAQAQAKAKQEVTKMKAQWEDEKAELARAMQAEFAKAVLSVTEKVLGKALDKKAHTQLIDQEIKNILRSS
jgi:F-type H+-transporting ATPase subunit b